MSTKCWICGEEADSGEHKFKASDLKRNYGKKFKAMYISESITPIQSYKDKLLKFPKVICQECNYKSTRSHDVAYDTFVTYCDKNFKVLLSNKVIDFKEIYGHRWEIEKKNLYKYFAKHAGCKIVTSDFDENVQELSDFIIGKTTAINFKIKFELKVIFNSLYQYFNQTHKYAHLFNGPTVFFGRNKDSLNYGGWLSYNWICVNWVFCNSLDISTSVNFEKEKEELYVIDFEEYSESFENYKDTKSLIEYLEYGKLDSLEKRIDHFRNIITS